MTHSFTFEAFVLAGGKSTRMGTDKGLMDFQGRKMIEHVLDALKISKRISIISNNEAYRQFGYPVYSDIYKDCGPLDGIITGLKNSNSDWCIAISCDLPFITSEILSFLLKNTGANVSHAIVPVHDNNIEPLCALYHKSSLPELERLLQEDEFKMHNVLKRLNTLYLDIPANQFDTKILFRNINSVSDTILHS